MQWILLFVGSIIGLFIGVAANEVFLCTFFGAFLGSFFGFNIRISRLTAMQNLLLKRSQLLKNELKQLQANKYQQTDEAPEAEQTTTNTAVIETETAAPLPSENSEQKLDTRQVTPTKADNASAATLAITTLPTNDSTSDPLTAPIKTIEIKETNQPLISTLEQTQEQRVQPQKQATQSPPEPVSQTPVIEQPKPSRREVKKQVDLMTVLYNKARDWLLGGNAILKVGAIILFLGLAFLLRYATEGMSFPIEGRYIAVAIGGFVLLGIGWRLREAPHNYGLILQGTGVAVLYLTSYAAMYLHQLLAPNTVFIFLLVFTVFAALLAVYQDALSLAIAATLGGFAAPILASSGGGNHVALFSYLLVLNLGILSMAWFKAWRPLNIIGFFGTFGMGFAWGIKAYTPAIFASTEPFLIIFFLLYVAIALLFARRKLYEQEHAPKSRDTLLHWSIKQTHYLDASLVFGTPIVAFGLQYTLVKHFTCGAAISALILGVFYLGQALIFHKFGSKRITLLMETNLALGIIFSTLAIPLAFDVEWTSATWALEAAGVFWISLKQQRKIGQLFASLLLYAASLSYLHQLDLGNLTLLQGSSFGAIILVVSLLFSFYQALNYRDNLRIPTTMSLPVFSSLGFGFFYLLAPLNLMIQETAICWVIMGLITLLVGNRIKLSSIFITSFIIQLLAIILMASQLPYEQMGIGFNTNTYQFIMFLLFGGLLVINAYFIVNIPKAEIGDNTDISLWPLKILLVAGLVIAHLSPLLVLPWLWTACLWAAMGCIMTQLAKRFNTALLLYAGLALPIAAMITFIFNNTLTSPIIEFFNINFVSLLVISIGALVMAWQIKDTLITTVSKTAHDTLSNVLLIGGLIGWSLAFTIEINALVASQYQPMAYLLIAAISILIAGLVANYFQWRTLSFTQVLLIPIAIIILNQSFFHPLNYFGWLAWAVLIVVHFFNLKHLENLMQRTNLVFCHTIGLWFIIVLLSSCLNQLLHMMGVTNTTWYWLVWVVVPCLWLLSIHYRLAPHWPVKTFESTYYYLASLPIAAYVFAWYWLANTFSTGAIALIPFIPLLNPLELGLIMAIVSFIRWLTQYKDRFPIELPAYFVKSLLGISLFAMSTAIVFRAAFNWLGVPFHFEDQIHSMSVQASLSILWTFIALTLMIRGHKKAYRELWLIGAVLITLVVVKLFFIELGNSGSLARIISFTIVGLLLLIVGYFAPLPPKTKNKQNETQQVSNS